MIHVPKEKARAQLHQINKILSSSSPPKSTKPTTEQIIQALLRNPATDLINVINYAFYQHLLIVQCISQSGLKDSDGLDFDFLSLAQKELILDHFQPTPSKAEYTLDALHQLVTHSFVVRLVAYMDYMGIDPHNIVKCITGNGANYIEIFPHAAHYSLIGKMRNYFAHELGVMNCSDSRVEILYEMVRLGYIANNVRDAPSSSKEEQIKLETGKSLLFAYIPLDDRILSLMLKNIEFFINEFMEWLQQEYPKGQS